MGCSGASVPSVTPHPLPQSSSSQSSYRTGKQAQALQDPHSPQLPCTSGALPAVAVPLGSVTVTMLGTPHWEVREEQMESPLSIKYRFGLSPCQACADSHVPPVLLPTGHLLRRRLRDAVVQAKAQLLAQRLLACCGALRRPGGIPQAVLEPVVPRHPLGTRCVTHRGASTRGTPQLCACSRTGAMRLADGAGSSEAS